MESPGKGLDVLVVDDSIVSRKQVIDALASQGYTVLLARSGEEALDLFAQRQPALVIADWVMDDVSGLDLCRKIRSASQQAYVYVIVLSGVSDKENIVKGLAAGADDYLTKPFNAEELLARIGVGRRIIELQRQIEAKNRLLETVARVDHLTHLPNRRAIEEWAVKQLRGAARHQFSLWLILADLDNFKSVNDSYGHDAGDVVLCRFAKLLQENSRASDLCGRLGGEEFVIVTTHADKKSMLLVAERLRREFEAERFLFNSEKVTVTASFGIAGFMGAEPPEFAALLREADRALYSAKRSGRNRVSIAEIEKVR